MATSGDRPSAPPITEERLQASLRRTEQRRANLRARRSRQGRFLLGALAAIILLILCIRAIVRERHNAPPAPLIVVTWPKPKIPQKFVSGSTVLVRAGQPFHVTVENAGQWTLQWHSATVVNTGSSMTWAPTTTKSTLQVDCRARGAGWRRFIAWLWPTRQVMVHGQMAPENSFQHKMTPPVEGLWVYPLINAKTTVHWDERALQQFMQADWLIPSKLTAGASQPLWTLVPSFEGRGALADKATYARLWSSHPEGDLPRLCRLMDRVAPTASIKFVVRLSGKRGQDPEGILRLAFDGQGQRGGWIKRPGQETATVIEWWADNPISGQLSPALPSRRR